MSNPVTGVLAWLFVGAVYYWLAYREQLWSKRGRHARVRRRPRWLDALCGVGSAGSRLESLHLPMAVLQLTGVAMAVGGPVLVVLVPYDGETYRVLTPALLALSAVPFALAELVMLARRPFR